MIRFARTVPPATEPVTRADVKAFAKIEHASEDLLIDTLITTARTAIENASGRALITQTWTATLDRWPCGDGEDDGWPFYTAVSARELVLAPAPAASVSSVVVDGVTIDAANYALRGDTLRVKASVAESTAELGGGIVITFVTGYGLAAAVPPPFVQATLRYAAHLYEHREESLAGFAGFPPALGVEALITPFKVLDI